MTSGILRGIEDGWFTAEIADAAFAYQRAAGEGREEGSSASTCHLDTIEDAAGDPAGLARGRARAGRARWPRAGGSRRGAVRTRAGTRWLAAATDRARNMIPPMLDAARAEATLGEICDVLRSIWGDYREAAFV